MTIFVRVVTLVFLSFCSIFGIIMVIEVRLPIVIKLVGTDNVVVTRTELAAEQVSAPPRNPSGTNKATPQNKGEKPARSP